MNHKASPDGVGSGPWRKPADILRSSLRDARISTVIFGSIKTRNHRERQEGPLSNFKQIQISRPQASPSWLPNTPTVYPDSIFCPVLSPKAECSYTTHPSFCDKVWRCLLCYLSLEEWSTWTLTRTATNLLWRLCSQKQKNEADWSQATKSLQSDNSHHHPPSRTPYLGGGA